MELRLWRFRFLPCVLLLAPGCGADSTLEPQTISPSLLLSSTCPLPFVTSGILEPINADNSSAFQLGRTIPVKIRISACVGDGGGTTLTLSGGAGAALLVSGGGVNTLTPTISLVLVDLGGAPVNELVSSSAADDGTTMRSAGDGQYLFNLSTKRSQFNAGEDLRPGVYELTISSPGDFADVVVRFAIRP